MKPHAKQAFQLAYLLTGDGSLPICTGVIGAKGPGPLKLLGGGKHSWTSRDARGISAQHCSKRRLTLATLAMTAATSLAAAVYTASALYDWFGTDAFPCHILGTVVLSVGMAAAWGMLPVGRDV